MTEKGWNEEAEEGGHAVRRKGERKNGGGVRTLIVWVKDKNLTHTQLTAGSVPMWKPSLAYSSQMCFYPFWGSDLQNSRLELKRNGSRDSERKNLESLLHVHKWGGLD